MLWLGGVKMFTFSSLFSEYREVIIEYLMKYLLVILLCVGVGIFLYILNSVALFKMSKTLGLKNAWISFVPILSVFSFGRVAQRYIRKDSNPSAKFSIWLLVLYLLQGLSVAAFSVLTVKSVIEILNNVGNAMINETEITLEMFSSFIYVIISFLVLFGIAIAYQIVYYVALWRIYAIFNEQKAPLFIVLSILFAPIIPVFLFLIRNKQPKLTFAERLGVDIQIID